MKKSTLTTIAVLLLLPTFICAQQYWVNSEWNLSFSTNDTSQYFYKKTSVTTDNSGDVYTLGNAITSTGHDFLIMKQDGVTGDTIFMTQWNGDGNEEDVSMDMYLDNATGVVYVVGGSVQDSTAADSLDACIVAFDNAGAEMWHTYASLSGPYNDIYASIAFDGSYIYACGTLGSASDGQDFVVARYDLAGAESGIDSYDFAGEHDVAIKIVANPGSALIATGIS